MTSVEGHSTGNSITHQLVPPNQHQALSYTQVLSKDIQFRAIKTAGGFQSSTKLRSADWLLSLILISAGSLNNSLLCCLLRVAFLSQQAQFKFRDIKSDSAFRSRHINDVN